ncbi:unnamed protein product [Rhizophagus irregularis]|nr:unnamed protein product [Rhizophagus irregularis]
MVNTIWTAGNSPGREVVNAVNKLHYNYKDETPEMCFETYEATVPNNIKPCLYSVVELAEAYCGSVWKYANSAQFQYLPHLEMIEDIEIWRASTPKPSLNGASAGDLAKPSLNGASAGDLAEAYFNSV